MDKMYARLVVKTATNVQTSLVSVQLVRATTLSTLSITPSAAIVPTL